MLFNSLEFLLFFVIVFFVYWYVVAPHLQARNLFLLIASYVFYGWWDWRFLSLIFLSTVIDYACGLKIYLSDSKKKKRAFLLLSILSNLGILGFFKYYNFFAENFAAFLSMLGISADLPTLQIILPVGISFYTFQTMSYTIDVYRGKIEPTRDFLAFAAFVSFFPQLVAGPIERAANLLPQFHSLHAFDYQKSVSGLRLILWGFFKKLVIADNAAYLVESTFSPSAPYQHGSTYLIGAIAFAFQIYGDFSGYSDIAVGTARLLGFELMRNFAYPYFSRDIAEFWRRWHISLSTWFRDYVYIPLGGSRVSSKWLHIRNVFVVFLLSGFWHGANWTFLMWGFLHACYYLPLMLSGRHRNYLNIVAEDRILPSWKEGFLMATTFLLVTLGWIFFRAENITHAFLYLNHLFTDLWLLPEKISHMKMFLTMTTFFLVMEWFGRREECPLHLFTRIAYTPLRWAAYYFTLLLIVFIGRFEEVNFIYFQF
jgi:D-alanyl-lipoteichoic acid acyltransferase DltB (MBOAT superfamily)